MWRSNCERQTWMEWSFTRTVRSEKLWKKKKKKAKHKLCSVLQLKHPCFNVWEGPLSHKQTWKPLILSHLSSLVQLPPWKCHISFQAKLCWIPPPVLWIDLTDGLLFLGCGDIVWYSLCLVGGGGGVPAASLQLADKRPGTAKPAGQLFRFSLSFTGFTVEV